MRYYDIDALRVLMTLLLLYYHVGKVFDSAYSHIGNRETSWTLELFTAFIAQWQMPLFFLMAGSATCLALRFRPGRQYVAERIRRLLIPFIFGILVLVPFTVYIERINPSVRRASPIDFNGSFFEFYPHFFQGMYPAGNFSPHHLWYVSYLFVFSLFLLPFFLYLRNHATGQRPIAAFADFISRGRAILLLAVPIALIQVVFSDSYPRSPTGYSFWMNNLQYVAMLVYGYLLVADRRVLGAVERNRRVALAVGLVLAAALIILLNVRDYSAQSAPPLSFTSSLAFWNVITTPRYVVEWTLFASGEWFLLVAIVGYGHQYLNFNSGLLQYASEIAYPFYILHQVFVIVIASYVVQWNAGVAPKFLIISTAALIATVASCEMVKQTGPTRFLFGQKARRKPAPELAAGRAGAEERAA
ncbi:MAG: acyltransferase [Chloroflexi bacterium]|nr:acyltransferase [Chloroflexota bacterium]